MEIASLPAKTTAGYDSFFWGGAMIGRFVGAVAAAIQADVLLVVCTSAAAALVTTSMILGGHAANRYMLLGRILLAAENCSELQLQGQLDRARTADLVERVETAIRPARSQAAGQSLRRLAEECVGQVVVGRAEVRVVEDVEELASATKHHSSQLNEIAAETRHRLATARNPAARCGRNRPAAR